ARFRLARGALGRGRTLRAAPLPERYAEPRNDRERERRDRRVRQRPAPHREAAPPQKRFDSRLVEGAVLDEIADVAREHRRGRITIFLLATQRGPNEQPQSTLEPARKLVG